MATGFRTSIAEIDQNGKIIKEIGGKDHPLAQKHNFHFFAGMQVLKNGNIVITNWSGHGKDDSEKGTQLLEFNNKNEIVWSWKNAKITGSPYHVIITDNLDLNKLNNEINVTLESTK